PPTSPTRPGRRSTPNREASGRSGAVRPDPPVDRVELDPDAEVGIDPAVVVAAARERNPPQAVVARNADLEVAPEGRGRDRMPLSRAAEQHVEAYFGGPKTVSTACRTVSLGFRLQ